MSMTLRLAALCALLLARTAVADPAKPAINADAILSITDLSQPDRPETEQILVQVIANTPDSEVDEKADYYFRLGTMYASRYHAKQKKEDLLRAVKTFKALSDNDAFRNYPRLDTALFYYGYTLQSGKYMKEARAVYDRLLKNYPSSKYVPEAHLTFAEYYFDSGQLEDAENRYKMVLKFPKSSVYWYAMYKVGWIHLDKQRFQEALETFFQVAHSAPQDPLGREATRDFVRAYAEIGKPDNAYAAFQRVNAKAAPDMLELLAELQLPTKPASAAVTYRQLLKVAPTHVHACRWQAALVQATAGTPDEEKASAALIAKKECTDLLSPADKQRAALSAIRGWEAAFPADVKLAAPAKKVPAEQAISAVDQAMLANLDRFSDQVTADQRVQMKLVKAGIYRKYAHHGEAIVILGEVVAHDRDSDFVERAVDLWLDSLLQLRRFDTALEVVDALAAEKGFIDTKPMLARNIQFLRSGSLR